MKNENPEIASPVRTRAIMETYGLNFKKSLGQNFLTDINILHKIVTAGNVSENDDVIEVGPGIGALTEQLAKSAHRVLALEVDERLIPVLAETLNPYDNVTVVLQDILKADLKELIKDNFDGKHPIKVVANLPYYITSPIILHLLDTKIDFSAIVVMMQKEVADRLSAQPGTKDYGALTTRIQYQMECKTAFIVPRTVFVPQPNVDSAIIVLTPLKERHLKPYSEEQLFDLVKGCFAHRRKSLWNNLQGIYGKEPEIKDKMQQVLAALQISPQIRAEQLSIDEFILLANKLSEAKIIEK
ncbi:16S rRNA (adenine(1518)-N(6)/adenine(1519)-N(6))-dimethyltransferase RsmA [Liquorilactobacillus hordei]|uniref:16S rRNA (adenine(1518)-N(6)/adenine(1519)-N(6))- dimethyltransferase RsmA n=1 Tax=Liquorilactobacillus hordei TaxID=468911 RepID=UPI001CBCC79D|nr:16S rRNA (adenine(1518)-N(6)/adenine(1519)-N(6))-dimethyltransferase RsmA [Liquorilactobacillus hordei]MBZ2406605.1 16S rRNA (adenine(1518)-N(6)/adenine(1519)-N(6))-dimethyltransferase [Liquorilactobacillus hordei]